MVTSILRGGLGNYMFQIGAAVTLAVKYNDTAVFDFNYTKQVHNNIKTYKQNLFRKLDDSLKVSKINIYNEPQFEFSVIPYKKDIVLSGNFQSEKYLDRDLILNLFALDSISKNYIAGKYGTDFNNCTSIHVRRGDYLLKQDRHPVLGMEYYNSAIEQFDNCKKFIIFSDDIVWCKANFIGDNFVFVEDEEDYIDLWLMSLCNNNIIANSSFSWWGAWLNTSIDKKIISPKHTNWFGKNKKLNTQDLIPELWDQI
jgi:hypothetical protein|tara:strand:- start:12107 stop:12871 length:765 start_codon:yes stop_codon:yes gene_type:complete